jgi:hypothetical protein
MIVFKMRKSPDFRPGFFCYPLEEIPGLLRKVNIDNLTQAVLPMWKIS